MRNRQSENLQTLPVHYDNKKMCFSSTKTMDITFRKIPMIQYIFTTVKKISQQ
jgi:uncharacterized membrane protein